MGMHGNAWMLQCYMTLNSSAYTYRTSTCRGVACEDVEDLEDAAEAPILLQALRQELVALKDEAGDNQHVAS